MKDRNQDLGGRGSSTHSGTRQGLVESIETRGTRGVGTERGLCGVESRRGKVVRDVLGLDTNASASAGPWRQIRQEKASELSSTATLGTAHPKHHEQHAFLCSSSSPLSDLLRRTRSTLFLFCARLFFLRVLGSDPPDSATCSPRDTRG